MFLRLQMNPLPSSGSRPAVTNSHPSIPVRTCDRTHVGLHFGGLLVPRFYEESARDVMDLYIGGSVSHRVNCESRVYWVNNLDFWHQQHGVEDLFGISNGATISSGIRFPLWNYSSDMGLNVYAGVRAGVGGIYYYSSFPTPFPMASHLFTQLAGSAGLVFGGSRGAISILIDAQRTWGPLSDSNTIGILTTGEWYFLNL